MELLTNEFGLKVIPITTINMGREMKKKVSPKNMDKYEVVHRFNFGFVKFKKGVGMRLKGKKAFVIFEKHSWLMVTA